MKRKNEYSIVWDFGDGNIASGTLTTSKDIYGNPGRCSPYENKCYSTVKTTNIYSKPGSYTVTFSVKNSKGARYENSETIIVGGKDSK